MCNGWTPRTLDELAVYHNGRAFKPSDWSDAGLPIIRIAQITDPDAQPNHYDGQDLDPRHLVDSGDLLFSWSATLAVVRWTKGPAVLNQHIFKVVEKPGVSKEFLRHLLDYSLPSLAGRSHGSTMKHIRKGVLREHRVLTPPLPEQRKIAAILSSVDDAIEKTQAVIDQVQVVKRGLMQELLTRGLPGQHRRFKRTQVGEVPEDWEISRISEIARCHYGTSVALKSEKGGLPVLRMGNLRDGRVNLDDVKYLEEGKVSDDLLLSRCDVLFNRTNSADLVGKVSVFDHSIRASFASYLLRLRTEPNIGNGRWLAYLLNTGTVQKILRATATPGVSQVNISRKNLLATTVPVPPIQEQAAIVAMLDSIQHRVEVEQSKVEHLAELKIGLMSVLLTGELRVTPDPVPE